MPPRRIRTRRRPSVALLAAAAALTGCGGGEPHARRADVAPLIALAHRIPGEPPCAQARDIRTLRARATAVVGRVPPALQEPLSSGVNALVEQTPTCVPTVAPASTTPVRLPPPAPKEHGHDHHEKHGHGKGHHD